MKQHSLSVWNWQLLAAEITHKEKVQVKTNALMLVKVIFIHKIQNPAELT